MAKLREGDPWMPGFRYGALLPPFSLNLLVIDTERSCAFYRAVFDAEIHYRDIDFAAVRVGPMEVMLHADHTHEGHPWHDDLVAGAQRGLGAQLRILGIDPDETERRSRSRGDRVGTVRRQGPWLARSVRARPGWV